MGIAGRGCALVAVALALIAAAPDEPLDGTAIMNAVEARPRGGDQTLRATWRIVRRAGRERVRKTTSYWLDCREEDSELHSKSLIFFDSPPDIKDTAFLAFSHRQADKNDVRWVYLPALRKVRRLSGSDRGKSFFGTEFSYEDLGTRDVSEDVHEFLGQTSIHGAVHYLVQSKPREDGYPYSKRIQYVHAAEFTVSRIDYYDGRGDLEKTLRAEWQLSDGVWLWKHLEMRNEQNGHQTTVEVTAVEHGSGLDDSVFTESSLRFGAP